MQHAREHTDFERLSARRAEQRCWPERHVEKRRPVNIGVGRPHVPSITRPVSPRRFTPTYRLMSMSVWVAAYSAEDAPSVRACVGR